MNRRGAVPLACSMCPAGYKCDTTDCTSTPATRAIVSRCALTFLTHGGHDPDTAANPQFAPSTRTVAARRAARSVRRAPPARSRWPPVAPASTTASAGQATAAPAAGPASVRPRGRTLAFKACIPDCAIASSLFGGTLASVPRQHVQKLHRRRLLHAVHGQCVH